MIVVTAPTSTIGRQLLPMLLDRGEGVRAVARDPARIPAEIRDRIEVVEGSHGDAAVVDAAFEAADAVFWLAPPNPKADSLDAAYAGFTRPAAAVFRRGGVGRVVGVSALGRGTPMADRAGLVTASLAMDDLIASTGVAYRALAMPSFMDNMLRQADSLRTSGVFHWPDDGDHKAPTAATRDIAASAARLLVDRSWGGSGHLAVLGPEDLSQNDLARILSEVLGKEIRHQDVPFDAFQAQLAGSGRMSPAFVDGYVAMMEAKREGLDNAEPRTAENTTPTGFRQWCEEVLRPAVLG